MSPPRRSTCPQPFPVFFHPFPFSLSLTSLLLVFSFPFLSSSVSTPIPSNSSYSFFSLFLSHFLYHSPRLFHLPSLLLFLIPFFLPPFLSSSVFLSSSPPPLLLSLIVFSSSSPMLDYQFPVHCCLISLSLSRYSYLPSLLFFPSSG